MSFSAAVGCAWLASWWPGFWIAAAALGLTAAVFGLRALNAPIQISPASQPDLRMVGRRAIGSAIVESHRDSRQEMSSRRDSSPLAESRRQTAVPPAVMPAPARYPLLRPEDEEEIEAMFQRLKSAGSMDVRNESEN